MRLPVLASWVIQTGFTGVGQQTRSPVHPNNPSGASSPPCPRALAHPRQAGRDTGRGEPLAPLPAPGASPWGRR